MLNDSPQKPVSKVSHNLPRQEVSSTDLQGILRKLREINRESPIVMRLFHRAKIVEFLVNSVQRIRNLGKVWQLQSDLDELIVQRQNALLNQIEYLESQLNQIQEQLDTLHNERYNEP
jgi:hypothetical protein